MPLKEDSRLVSRYLTTKATLIALKIIRIDVAKNDDAAKLGNKIIRAFGEEPRRLLLDRGDQLKDLFDWYIERDFIITIVISSAHLLNSETIYDLKIMREFSSRPFPNRLQASCYLGILIKLKR